MKLVTFFISRTKQMYTKTLAVSESTFKIKAMSPWTLFKIFLTSAVIYKPRFWLKNEIVQYIQDVNHGHFRKPIQLP